MTEQQINQQSDPRKQKQKLKKIKAIVICIIFYRTKNNELERKLRKAKENNPNEQKIITLK